MTISYRLGNDLHVAAVADLYRSSGIEVPTDDLARLARMVQTANLIVSAWHDDRLVGIARSVTDFVFCCYLSELAVDRGYQRLGIGTELVRRTRAQLGDGVKVILLSVPTAMEFYAKLGFVRDDSALVLPRKGEDHRMISSA